MKSRLISCCAKSVIVTWPTDSSRELVPIRAVATKMLEVINAMAVVNLLMPLN